MVTNPPFSKGSAKVRKNRLECSILNAFFKEYPLGFSAGFFVANETEVGISETRLDRRMIVISPIVTTTLRLSGSGSLISLASLQTIINEKKNRKIFR